ncbi:hypothetical protein [Methanobacterium formicicum]|uniref:Uncharacterized protein n=1 Tax=Methanobacterium formicicum (strain DSM 3637 / PP1) TaxID=1204725 RepID=K2RDS8_METFP|nr:hypothetical protein [Methanobacterium formicicum]EKF86499.1 hypothetical protein A994_03413 [Methanobacterium formicicum DSM 3637]
MAGNYLLRTLFGFLLKHRVLSIGTKYYPTNEKETEYVEMVNYTRTMLLEIERANITTENIFHNLLKEVGRGNIPENRRFVEIKPAENDVNEYALLSNIIMGSDRYLYVEVFGGNKGIIDQFVQFIQKEKGTIVERSNTEIVSRLLSKNDAIRVGVELIKMGMEKQIDVRAAAGMTGAASIERSINLNKQIGETSGVGFTKLGGEFAIVFSSKITKLEGTPAVYDNYLFIDAFDSTQFIEEQGRDRLVEIMNEVKDFIEKECNGRIEGYREGGDDLIANLPTKDAALRAGIDSAWHALNNGARLRVGIGKSRREAGERAQMADDIKIWNNSPVMVFDLADGIYAYYIPSEFSRAVIEFMQEKTGRIVLIFVFVFIVTLIGWNVGYWEFGLVAIALALLYALTA